MLEEYFREAGEVTAANAWQHVYRVLLWLDERTQLAHIYDSNHMQQGGAFYSRAVRFTDEVSKELSIDRKDLGNRIDVLFKGCVAELLKREGANPAASAEEVAQLALLAEEDGEELDESELIGEISDLLASAGVAAPKVPSLARAIEERARRFFTLGNKRKNALGEGFEDLLTMLLEKVSKVPTSKIQVRKRVSALPGFKKVAQVRGRRRGGERLPKPDIAITDEGVTQVITTAKWSMRQDRETQFASEYDGYQKNKVQTTELQFVLITNEFDVARLDNVARAQPGGAGGYIFHTIYHINPQLLLETQGERIGAVRGWIDAGKIGSLEDFLLTMRERFGT